MIPRWQLHRLAEAILEWVNADPAYRRGMQEAARRKVVDEFNFSRERIRMQQVLDALCHR
jgi:hypothetical protein